MATLTINTTDGTGWGTTLSGGALTAMNAVWDQAVRDLQDALVPPVNNVTITITREYAAIGGGGIGTSSLATDFTSYTAIRNCYLSTMTPSNSVQTNNWTSANIPSTPPTTELNTGNMQGTMALSVAIGRVSTTTSGTIRLSSGVTWDTSAVRGDSVSGSGFTAYGTIMHELTEHLGRGANADKFSPLSMPMDLFVYSGVGTHCTTQATTRYISVAGGGVTPILYNMDTNTSDDPGDTAGPNNSPSFAGSDTAQQIKSRSSSLPLFAADWQMMTMIGWNLSATGLVWAGLNSAPVNSVLPVIGGTLKTGNAMTVTPGTWSNSPTLTYQWKKNGSNIGGATSTTYTPTNADRDALFSCDEIANASTDNVTATAASVGPWLVNSRGAFCLNR